MSSSQQSLLPSEFSKYIIPYFLFVLLVPGLVLSLPGTSASLCENIVPFPTDYDGTCDGLNHGSGGTTGSSNAAMDIVCKARAQCKSLTFSNTVSVGAAFLHALVFITLVYLMNRALAAQQYM